MPLNRVACPSCNAGLKSAAGFAVGQKIRCPKCQTAFAVQDPEELPLEDLPEEEPVVPPPPKTGAAKKPIRAIAEDLGDEDEDDDDRPAKSRKKGKKAGGSYRTSPLRFVILGVLLLVLGVMAFLLIRKNQRENELAKAPPASEPSDEDLSKPIKGMGGAPKAGGKKFNNDLVNLKVLAIAMHGYASRQPNPTLLPPAAIRDTTGMPLLSWRVAILPDLEQGTLYKQFKLDEPWDSDNNKKLLSQMPKFYQSDKGNAPNGQTYFKVFVGKSAWFAENKPNLTPPDGASNTILIAEGGVPVPWTKPEDFVYDPTGPLPDLTPPGGGDQLAVVMGDISARKVNRKVVAEKSLRAAITWNGGEMFGPDW